MEWLEPLGVEVREAKGIALLREVFSQQYEVDQSGKTSTSSVESIEPVKVHATGVVQNPHDPDAQGSAKGQGKQKKHCVGYKVQVAETVACQEDQSSFITSVVTQRATESDDAGLPATLQKQEGLGLERPLELYADGAYICGRAIHEAKEDGWQLVGPAQPSASRAGLEKAYRIEAFDISITERKAVCPAGETSTNCSKLTEEKSGKVTYRFEFGNQCHNCLRAQNSSSSLDPCGSLSRSAATATARSTERRISASNAPTKCDRRNSSACVINARSGFSPESNIKMRPQLVGPFCGAGRPADIAVVGDQQAPHIGEERVLGSAVGSAVTADPEALSSLRRRRVEVEGQSQSKRLVDVKVAGIQRNGSGAGSCSLEVVSTEDRRITVRRDFDAETLARLIRTIEEMVYAVAFSADSNHQPAGRGQRYL